MTDPGNKDYYLASAFSGIFLQSKGELNLHGLILTQHFLKDALEQCGIKMHVFKHGAYKNFPNMFTEMGFNKPHREATASILQSLHESVFNDILKLRSEPLYYPWAAGKHNQYQSNVETWTFPAKAAFDVGFVDFLIRRDALGYLLFTEADNVDQAIGLSTYKETTEMN
jgi:hypothetical protein